MIREQRTLRLQLLAVAFVALPAGLLAQPRDTRTLLDAMTLEEKASLVTGIDWWETHPVHRLGIPSVWMADGPAGLRKVEGERTVSATCFPSAGALAATWNLDLIETIGSAIGAEARYNGVTLLLGPGLNMKRHPRGGRNFEYYSEDPLLSGRTAAAFVRGVQSRGVGATLKHYAVNNQEHRRMLIDARLSERTLREIYLRGFEIAVREGYPQAVMTAYNKVNGTFATQHPYLLTDILRGEWGFKGMVVSDWGSTNDPVASVAAGLDLEMPGNPLTPPQIVSAVREGRLDESDLDRAVLNVLQLVERQSMAGERSETNPIAANHDLARDVAAESTVLLQNDGILPFTNDEPLNIGVLGQLAHYPRIQGVGSSQVNPTKVDTAWSYLRHHGEAQGHTVETWGSNFPDIALTIYERGQLVRFFQDKDVVVIFAGQEESHDAEAWDRPSIDLSADDQRFIRAAERTRTPYVVVLVGGGAVNVGAFANGANAILMGWLGGQAFGSAIADVLFGLATPSGKLSETFAWSIADHPSDVNFPGGPWTVDYGEGIYVGYRYFQSFGHDVAYPFGHGLSYTTFEYQDAHAPDTLYSLGDGFDVTVRVGNTGDRSGAETVQLYLRHLNPTVSRPERELIGFQKLLIAPGRSKEYTIHVDPGRFAYFSERHDHWVIEPGSYELLVGTSSEDIRFTLPLELLDGTMPTEVYTLDHTLGEIHQDTQGRIVVDAVLTQSGRQPLTDADADDFQAAIMRDLPFRKLSNFSDGTLTLSVLERLLDLVNSDLPPEQVIEALSRMTGGT